ncbi:unnamed protein product [Trichogramma brassicae]|uniref:Uncharacterized protein n=1 Tax=Trichogramma brassicae TaxID=86971 RepID=A0A6H5IFS6_9HYME|nr:unnamed protein product [Trichogramma brassicae]
MMCKEEYDPSSWSSSRGHHSQHQHFSPSTYEGNGFLSGCERVEETKTRRRAWAAAGTRKTGPHKLIKTYISSESIHRLRTLIGHLGLERPLPNLGAILRPGEIEWLLAYNVLKPEQLGEHDYRYSVIDFVAKTGYKDVPEAVDSYGRPSSRRTTVVHQMFQSSSSSSAGSIPTNSCRGAATRLCTRLWSMATRTWPSCLLEAGADPNFVHCKHGATPLHIIISMEKQKTSIDFLEMFFAICRAKGHGVDIDALDAKGLAPLHYALISGHARATELLVDNGADPNSSGPQRIDSASPRQLERCSRPARRGEEEWTSTPWTPRPGRRSTWPCAGAAREVASGLLKWGADPNSQYNELGETALHVVCADYLEDDMEDVLYDILESGRCRINAVDSLGKTPLHVALAGGRQNIVHALLVHGADPNQPDSDGSTPLHMVCQKRLEDGLTGMLFEYCERRYLPVQVDAQDGHGKTPLHWAVYLGHQNSVHELLVNGADPNLADHQGSTPLHLLCQRPNVDDFAQLFFEWCVAQGRCLAWTSTTSWAILRCTTPWPTPARSTSPDCCWSWEPIQIWSNNEGSMPLHNICKREQYYDDCLARLFIYVNYQILRQLQIDARDNLGRTPLELAVANHLPHVVQVLLSHGADLSSFAFFPTEAYIAKFDRSLGLRYNLTTIKVSESPRPSREMEELHIGSERRPENHGSVRRARNARGVGHARTRLGRERGLRERSDGHHDKFGPVAPRSDPAAARVDQFSMIYRAACDTFLCHQSMARRFFQRWTAEYFRLLFHSWLPILCCDLIIENLDLTGPMVHLPGGQSIVIRRAHRND